MTDVARLSLPDRFTSLMEGVMEDVVGHVPFGWVPIPLIVRVWRRLRRMKARFGSIVARLRAGTLAAPGRARGRPGRVGPAAASRLLVLPRQFGWLVAVVSWFLLARHHELVELLEDPEAPTLVAAAPQLGSVLRPLCHMLSTKQPAWLRRPRRARRARRRVEIPPAPEWLVKEPGAICKADGTVWMHMGSSTHWKPGCGITLEQARKFDPPRKIWPRRE